MGLDQLQLYCSACICKVSKKISRVLLSIKLVYQYMAIFFNFQTTSNHLHALEVENCDSNSWLVVNEYKNGKFRLEMIKHIPFL